MKVKIEKGETQNTGENKMDTFQKRTFNDVIIKLWETSNGYEIGSNFQICHRGYLTAEVAFLVWGEVTIFDFSEVFELVKQARILARRKGTLQPGDLRVRTNKAIAKGGVK